MSRIGWIVLGSILLIGIIIGMTWVSANNKEVGLRNAITAKQKDNQSRFDNMWKTISQTAQVSEKDRESLSKIFVEHAQARTGNGEGGSVMKWIQESVPTVDSSLFKNLQNIILSSREGWTRNQTEILDLKREHDNVLDKFPSSIFVGGRSHIEVQIVTSGRTKEAFDTGVDESTNVFQK